MRFILLFALLALVIPASASAFIQTGYLRGYNGAALAHPTWGRIYIRDNVTGAVGSTYTRSAGNWYFGNIVAGRSYTYWGIYTPACVRYFTAKFTRSAPNGSWFVGSINLQGGVYVC